VYWDGLPLCDNAAGRAMPATAEAASAGGAEAGGASDALRAAIEEKIAHLLQEVRVRAGGACAAGGLREHACL